MCSLIDRNSRKIVKHSLTVIVSSRIDHLLFRHLVIIWQLPLKNVPPLKIFSSKLFYYDLKRSLKQFRTVTFMINFKHDSNMNVSVLSYVNESFLLSQSFPGKTLLQVIHLPSPRQNNYQNHSRIPTTWSLKVYLFWDYKPKRGKPKTIQIWITELWKYRSR